MRYEKELHTALGAVLEASALCLDVQTTFDSSQVTTKNDRSPVTVADIGSQVLIAARLRDAFGDDVLIGEEDSGALDDGSLDIRKVLEPVQSHNPAIDEAGLRSLLTPDVPRDFDFGSRYWTVDPIDGTKGYLRKEQFAVACALVENGRPVLGILGCPNLPLDPADPDGLRGCLFWAIDGAGAFCRSLDNERDLPITTDALTSPADALLCESVESGHKSGADHERVIDALHITAEPVRMDSQCKYAAVARGEASIYLRFSRGETYREKIWDHAAGAAVIREAGGTVTDLNGKELDFSKGPRLLDNTGIVASNGHLHAAVIEAIGGV